MSNASPAALSKASVTLHALTLWVPTAIAATVLAGLVEVAVQQDLRHSAEDPQIQMAEDAASALGKGGQPQPVVGALQVDMSTSLAPYLIVFDDTGQPVNSSVQLNGQVPLPPDGVFDYTRQKGEDRFTWQPAPGVRSAAVVNRFEGQHPGFVLAGRSLREIEQRESQLVIFVLFAWAASLGTSLAAATLLAVLSAKGATAS